MKPNWLTRLENYRTTLFVAIKKALEEDSHCKSYEGQVHMVWPHYFGCPHSMRVDCYLLGPTRHYEYRGNSFNECLDKAEADLAEWIKERGN